MLQDAIINQYISTINLYKIDVIDDLLVLYKIGANKKHRKVKELQLHNGYQNALKRYLFNKTTLTTNEVLGILELYVLRPEYELPQGYIIVNIPKPNVHLLYTNEAIFRITDIPKPNVLLGEVSAYMINYIPKPNISIDTMDMYAIDIMPKPNVKYDLLDVYGIDSMPKVNVRYDGMPIFDITSIPKPNIKIGDDIAAYDITSIPKPNIYMAEDMEVEGAYFYGVYEVSSQSEPPPAEINFESLTRVYSNAIANELEITYPVKTGYYIFALPDSALLRTRWYISQYNSGTIGGAREPVQFSNLWPDPIQQTYGGVVYNVYITSYATKITDTVKLMI